MIDTMRVARAVLDYLIEGGVRHLFGIPAGSVNAIFDELYDLPQIEPVIVKHEGAAGYMAAAYARATGRLAVCIGSSGPGATNLLTGAANAMREHLPVLFLTGHVPVQTQGRNASQELAADPLFRPVTKSSVTVQSADEALSALARAVETACEGVPGPVHVALPIDIQLADVPPGKLPPFPCPAVQVPPDMLLREAGERLARAGRGFIFIGQGARKAMDEVMAVSRKLGWPIVSSPQAKGLVPDDEPAYRGIYGFAGDESCASFIHDHPGGAVLIVGSSLGETATNNYNPRLATGREVVQVDIDASVFNRTYPCAVALVGDAAGTLRRLLQLWREDGVQESGGAAAKGSARGSGAFRATDEASPDDFNTTNVLARLQTSLPKHTRYTVDIGEFMSYVIHGMKVYERHTFDINVHFGPMGVAMASAIGWALADPGRPTVCITGDGCFFMHGMEVLTAKELRLPILWVVFNNARLGMVHHGHRLQYGRAHRCFAQTPVDIAALAAALGVRSARVERLEEMTPELVASLLVEAPAALEIALVDDRTPPMGDRVKFLSSFGQG